MITILGLGFCPAAAVPAPSRAEMAAPEVLGQELSSAQTEVLSHRFILFPVGRGVDSPGPCPGRSSLNSGDLLWLPGLAGDRRAHCRAAWTDATGSRPPTTGGLYPDACRRHCLPPRDRPSDRRAAAASRHIHKAASTCPREPPDRGDRRRRETRRGQADAGRTAGRYASFAIVPATHRKGPAHRMQCAPAG